jgi:hypothetical protein
MTVSCRTLTLKGLESLSPEEKRKAKRDYFREVYYPKNKDHILAKQRERYSKDPERHTRYSQNWNDKNPNYRKEYYKKRHIEHPEEANLNRSRTPEMWNAHNKAEKIPLAKYCELCPNDDLKIATHRAHLDYDYPEIFVSTCQSCHTASHRWEEKQRKITLKETKEMQNK